MSLRAIFTFLLTLSSHINIVIDISSQKATLIDIQLICKMDNNIIEMSLSQAFYHIFFVNVCILNYIQVSDVICIIIQITLNAVCMSVIIIFLSLFKKYIHVYIM